MLGWRGRVHPNKLCESFFLALQWVLHVLLIPLYHPYRVLILSVLLWSIFDIKILQKPPLHWCDRVRTVHHIERRRPSLDGRGAEMVAPSGYAVLTSNETDRSELQNSYVDQNVKTWLVLHLEMVIGDGEGGCKWHLMFQLCYDNFLKVIDNEIAVVGDVLPIPKCSFASLFLSFSKPLLCSVGFLL